MHSELRAQIAFRLTGLRSSDAKDASIDTRNLRPALTARFRNLAALRYDFPLVFPPEPLDGAFAIPLTTVVDGFLEKAAGPEVEDAADVRVAVLRLEREIRVLLGQGARGSLQTLWELAAARLTARDASLAPILQRARKSLAVEGEVRDCDAALAGDFVLHAWNAVQKRKAARFHDEIHRLIVRLSEILAADDARSALARSPQRLRESFGTSYRETFDFEAMSKLLGRGAAKRPLSDARRRRLRSLLVALESQRFYMDDSGFTFAFDRCGVALRAFRARYPRLRSLARSMAIARLEVEGEYDERRHDALFQQTRQSPLTAAELARFPDYLVRVRESDLDPAGRAELLELFSSGVPAKVLLQSDDILEDASSSESLAAVASRADLAAGMALGLDDVFVVQASASSLPRLAAEVARAIEYPGPALFNVFSGATGDSACLPAYLNAAAATESRAFPTFTYDPAKPLEGGSRFSIEHNPQPGCDWPVHGFDYEDAQHQGVHEDLRFTIADFVAADERFARHFLAAENGARMPLADWLESKAPDEQVSPVIPMTDQDDALHHVVVDEAIASLSRRAVDRWRRLQKLAAMGVTARIEVPVVAEPAAEVPAAVEAAPATPASVPAAEAPKAASSDDPYIETPRCTTCNECTQLNNKMFAYDGNKQAYIADLNAGTYRQLVEAAESCQVSIIHPGKPRNPDEPGLEELIERASVFR